MKKITQIKVTNLIYTASLAAALFIVGYASPAFADSPISGNCIASPSTSLVGDNVTWQAQNATGGNGLYTYTWSGTDNLSANGQSVSKSYSYPGTKVANLTIASNGQSYTTTCSTVINSTNSNYYNQTAVYNYNGSLGASCYAMPSSPNLNETVTWYGNAVGGSGYYTYTWSGSDSLSGNSSTVNKSYSTLGQKVATLTVYSNGQSVTQTCVANVGNYATSNNSNYTYYNGYNGYNNYNNNCYYTGSTYTCNNINSYNNGSYYNGSYYNGSYYSSYYPTSYYNNPVTYSYPYSSYTSPTYSYPVSYAYTVPTTYTSPTYVAPVTYTTPTYTTQNYSNRTYGTPAAGVYLNQVPSTGKAADTLKITLFSLGLIGWSLFAAFIIRKRIATNSLTLVSNTGSSRNDPNSIAKRIEEFKKNNLAKKSLLK